MEKSSEIGTVSETKFSGYFFHGFARGKKPHRGVKALDLNPAFGIDPHVLNKQPAQVLPSDLFALGHARD
jgi:hypothetical protein